jgi:endo-1,4-beta-xylanase
VAIGSSILGKSHIWALVFASYGVSGIFGCDSSPGVAAIGSGGGSSDVGGTSAVGGAATGGSSAVSPGGGSPATGGAPTTGGSKGTSTQPSGGSSATGGTAAGGNSPAVGGNATGGAGVGGAATGGNATLPTGGKASGGSGAGGAATGGKSATGGVATAGAATGGKAATGGAAATAGTATTASAGASDGPDCSATMPTEGGKSYTGASVNGTISGLNYGIWTNGDGGTITVFPSTPPAFSTSWSESKNFLAHLGLDFYGSAAKAYTAFGTITAQYVEKKSGTAGSFSMIGIYGWTQSPCVEWYINEDSYGGLYGGGSVTATIDGGTYSLSSVTTTGTDGANACESGHTGSWTQMKSTRKTARQCGTVTVSDHFAAWEQQGWTLGKLTMVHINIEVGGGTGSIDFPVANVTTTSK